MRTSEEIYHRICWDPRFDAARFVLGIDVHASAPKRVPLAAFVPGGDHPWHRVVFIEADGERVWDRHAGIDRLDAAEAGRVRVPPQLRAPFFVARPPHRWDAATACWTESPASSAETTAPAPTGVRCVTWNTLWDRFDADRIHTARRRPLLLNALRDTDADVIALQEVEPPLLEALLRADWVRARYVLSEGPAARDVARYGVLLLSRWPVRELALHALGPHKCAVAMTLAWPGGALVVLATHLTSDHSDPQRRPVELESIREALAPVEGEVVVLGDFNDASHEPSTRLGLADAWTEVHGTGDETPTFDPTVNPLAAISSLRGRALRIDRVFLRGTELQATGAKLLGTAPTADGLFPSDHYGLEVSLAVGPRRSVALDLPPTARTALAFVLPAPVSAAVQRLRRAHDPSFERWPPHVNVVFGFVPEWSFDAALPLIAEALREVGAFRARFEETRVFTHAAESTVWLDPAAHGPGPWQRLREALRRRFPACTGRGEGFTPHLTLGRVADPAKVRAAWAASVGGFEVEVTELVLLSRRGAEAMQPRAFVSLGTGAIRPAHPTSADPPRPPRTAAAEAVVESLERAFTEGRVHVTGSRRLGCALPEADLDLVLALPGPLDLDAVEARVRATFDATVAIRRVHAARLPGIELRTPALDIDLTVVDTGDLPPDEAVRRRAELGEAAAIALSAVSDADAIMAAVTVGTAAGAAAPEAFATSARRVKAWARARGLDAAAFGGVAGLGWLVLCARSFDPSLDADAQLERFFGTWAAWDFSALIALDPAAEIVGAPTDPLRIATPTAPVRSCTGTVTRAGAITLAEELYAAWELVTAARAVGRDPLPALLAPPDLHRQHAAFAVITAETSSPEKLADVVGGLRGRVRALLTRLEHGGVEGVRAFPRPFESTATRARYALGLGRCPPSFEALARLTGGWEGGGVTVTRVEGGEVPTLR